MIDLGAYPAVNGSFPNVTTKNSTAPTTKDGTPIRKLLVDDIFGFFQAIASQGGIIPSGVNDDYSDSDLLNGIRNVTGGPGEIVLFCGPYENLYTTNKRIIPLIGQSVNVTSYQDLVDVTYVGDADNSSASSFYKTSDSFGVVRSTTGSYFWLPDCRGVFLRGFDNGGGIDPDNETRDMWSLQLSSIREHLHSLRKSSLGDTYVCDTTSVGSGSGELHVLQMVTSALSQVLASDYAGMFNDDETRPSNLNPVICIRY